MKASEVTKAMLDAFDENIDTSLDSEQKIIAFAVNAVLGDTTPITAERLVEGGWTKIGDMLERRVSEEMYLLWDGFDVTIIDYDESVDLPSIKTLGQLRALEIGLGLRD